MKRNVFQNTVSAVLMIVAVLVVTASRQVAGATIDPDNGNPEAFFGTTNLYTFHFTIAADQWATMNETDQQKVNAAPLGNNARDGSLRPREPRNAGAGAIMGIEFKKGTAQMEFQGQSFGAIRIRFKGNSSFRFAGNTLKCSLKLDFNDLEKGRTFFGLTKLNLNNNAMDPSQLREALAYDIFRNGGVPASRTAFARVYITVPGRHNHAYAGLYTIVEQVDDHFLKARFATKSGMLLKPERAAGLPYRGDDWAAYTNQVQPKTTVSGKEAARFLEFVKCLNQADDQTFQTAVRNLVEIDEFLRFLALESLLSNMDSPLITGHNFYLYLHPKSCRFIWIPWDLNEAFGGFTPGGSQDEQMNLSIDQSFTPRNRFAARLMQVPGIKEHYHEIVRGMIATNFTAARLFPLMDAMAAVIRSSVSEDLMLSMPQFDAALAEAKQPGLAAADDPERNSFRPEVRRRGGPGRPRTPLKAFLTQRINSVQAQLSGQSKGYVPSEMRPGPNGRSPVARPNGNP